MAGKEVADEEVADEEVAKASSVCEGGHVVSACTGDCLFIISINLFRNNARLADFDEEFFLEAPFIQETRTFFLQL